MLLELVELLERMSGVETLLLLGTVAWRAGGGAAVRVLTVLTGSSRAFLFPMSTNFWKPVEALRRGGRRGAARLSYEDGRAGRPFLTVFAMTSTAAALNRTLRPPGAHSGETWLQRGTLSPRDEPLTEMSSGEGKGGNSLLGDGGVCLTRAA